MYGMTASGAKRNKQEREMNEGKWNPKRTALGIGHKKNREKLLRKDCLLVPVTSRLYKDQGRRKEQQDQTKNSDSRQSQKRFLKEVPWYCSYRLLNIDSFK